MISCRQDLNFKCTSTYHLVLGLKIRTDGYAEKIFGKWMSMGSIVENSPQSVDSKKTHKLT